MFALQRMTRSAMVPRTAHLAATPKVMLRRSFGRSETQFSWASYHNGAALVVAAKGAARGLREPLAKLTLLLELLDVWNRRQAMERAASRSGQTCRTIADVDDAIHAMLGLASETGDALNFSPEFVDLEDVVATVVSLTAAAAQGTRLDLAGNAAGRITLWADPALVMQAIGHAVDHLSAGSGASKTVLCEVAKHGDSAVVRIDNPGKPAVRSACAGTFRPFPASDAAADAGAAAPDLRLWLFRLIAERHAGSVRADIDQYGDIAGLEMRLPLDAG